MQILLVALVLLLLAAIVLLLMILSRMRESGGSAIVQRLEAVDSRMELINRTSRESAVDQRGEIARSARDLREEISGTLRASSDSLLARLAEATDSQRRQLDQIRKESTEVARATASDVAVAIARLNESNEVRLEGLRATVDAKLGQIQQDNEKKLDAMRETVGEKLHGMLEQRLGESFRLVSERLEIVHKGLGEMQALASGVGDLKKVLSNVKVRGGWGEVQLGNLLEQMLAPDQFARNVKVREGSNEIVEYAIRLPGRLSDGSAPVWLPIDAKFPQEDYARLVDALEAADVAAADQATKQLEARIRSCALDICTKYLDPPATTDFAIMFLPTEGLYAEVIRRTGLVDSIQRDCRVVVAGPTTLAALLNSLQMGFRTLAIEKRSSEVWAVLAAVKTEFTKFGDVIDKVHKKLDETTRVVESVRTRQRVMQRKLRDVQELPAQDTVLRISGVDGIAAASGEPDPSEE